MPERRSFAAIPYFLRTVAPVLAAIVFASACHAPAEAPLPRPLVVIGVDGLEWRLVLDLAKAGRMREITRIVNEGTSARLSTLEPALSPPIWTSMATGVVPERHGILGFVQPGTRDGSGN